MARTAHAWSAATFTRWSKADRIGVEQEGLDLLAFASDGEGEHHAVRLP